jgi:hypothetical protein
MSLVIGLTPHAWYLIASDPSLVICELALSTRIMIISKCNARKKIDLVELVFSGKGKDIKETEMRTFKAKACTIRQRK